MLYLLILTINSASQCKRSCCTNQLHCVIQICIFVDINWQHGSKDFLRHNFVFWIFCLHNCWINKVSLLVWIGTARKNLQIRTTLGMFNVASNAFKCFVIDDSRCEAGKVLNIAYLQFARFSDKSFFDLCLNNSIILTMDQVKKVWCLTFGQRDSGTYIREQAEHFWPLYSKEERIVDVITESTSADEWTKWKFFPPHSPIRRGKLRYLSILLPTCFHNRLNVLWKNINSIREKENQ